jgi:scyllo-inositol 2-dehydrogenase (NADP+)
VIDVGVVGVGKMGLSHHALLNAHPEVNVAGICDSSRYVLGVLEKNTGVAAYGDFEQMLDRAELDAVFVATPSSSHAGIVETAIDRGLHVFCEKPLTLRPDESRRLVELAQAAGVVTQVGYHNRLVAAFREVKSLLGAGAIGRVTHIQGEAYGPVVLKAKGSTWRSRHAEGGGCLYDYAAHVINLVNWYFGKPAAAGGSALPSVFSRDTDDSVFSTLFFPEGRTGQLSVNWSDESYRKMTTRIGIWGTGGRIFADRQECQVYVSESGAPPPGYVNGWNVRYTTELTAPVWFYLRGEEYSAQIEAFVDRVAGTATEPVNDFESAAVTDETIGMVLADAASGAKSAAAGDLTPARQRPGWRFWRSRAA